MCDESKEQRSGSLGKNIYKPGTREIIGHTSDAKKKKKEQEAGKGKLQRVSKVPSKELYFAQGIRL